MSKRIIVLLLVALAVVFIIGGSTKTANAQGWILDGVEIDFWPTIPIEPYDFFDPFDPYDPFDPFESIFGDFLAMGAFCGLSC